MKKAWNDVKSFVTVLFAIAIVVFTFMGKCGKIYLSINQQ